MTELASCRRRATKQALTALYNQDQSPSKEMMTATIVRNRTDITISQVICVHDRWTHASTVAASPCC